MGEFNPMRTIPEKAEFKKGDVMVIFGELFERGYANGIVDEALKLGMQVIYSTVGRRDENDKLRPLTAEELSQKNQPLINIPLEAGFDLTPAPKSDKTPVDQLQGLKLSDWQTAQMNWDDLEQSRLAGIESFRSRVREWLAAVEKVIPQSANVLFVHTMAGGVPRAKIIMPAMNRVFKGFGDRYASSLDFWQSDLGRFCDKSFNEVTAETLDHLLNLSSALREKITTRGNKVSYVAYGYHGTDVLMGSSYQWQSYSPYLQGFAKLQLEKIAQKAWTDKIKVSVFNAPEILTNSSSIFLGVEVSLYPLLGALHREGSTQPHIKKLLDSCMKRLKAEVSIEQIMDYTHKYFTSNIIKKWSAFEKWPQHNGPEQMALMRSASSELIALHEDQKNLITADLSEVVFRSCGNLMLREAWNPQKPVWWIGHDVIAKQQARI